MVENTLRVSVIGLLLTFAFALSGCGGPATNTAPANTKPAVETKPSKATFLAVGDIMLSRGVARLIDREGELAPFNSMADVFRSTDFNFGNFETPVSGNDTRVGKGLVFNTRKKDVEGLVKYNFKIVGLANNHALDQGEAGLRHTMAFLPGKGIEYVGVGETPEEAWKGKIITANGIKIGFIAASYSSYNDNGSRRNPFVARIEDVELMRNSIQRLRDEGCQFVVATMHAGIEYTRRPHQPQIDFARAAIDNGADIVIGGHPHWIQTTEVYRGKYIFYSLGNFIFDQRKPDTMEGLAIKVTVAHDGGVNVEKTARLDRVDLIPVIVERFGAPRVANPAETAAILRKIGVTDPVISPK